MVLIIDMLTTLLMIYGPAQCLYSLQQSLKMNSEFFMNILRLKPITIEFDEYIGPSILAGEKIVSIPPETVSFDPRSNVTGAIRQVPLVLGWAITIHKSQALTLDRAIVDIGDSERQTGLTYVACSRMRSAFGLAFAKSFPFERLQRLNDSQRLKLVSDEIQRLTRLVQNLR